MKQVPVQVEYWPIKLFTNPGEGQIEKLVAVSRLQM